MGIDKKEEVIFSLRTYDSSYVDIKYTREECSDFLETFEHSLDKVGENKYEVYFEWGMLQEIDGIFGSSDGLVFIHHFVYENVELEFLSENELYTIINFEEVGLSTDEISFFNLSNLVINKQGNLINISDENEEEFFNILDSIGGDFSSDSIIEIFKKEDFSKLDKNYFTSMYKS